MELAQGGADAHGGAHPLQRPEIWDPASPDVRWVRLARAPTARYYHSTALLLPDGRVLTGGTDIVWNYPVVKRSYTELDVFSPPYLFTGHPRPVILWAPKEVGWGARFEIAVEQQASIRSAVLIRNGSCTHYLNTDQRLIELRITARNAKRRWVSFARKPFIGPIPQFFEAEGLELEAPPAGFIAPAPPGYYMLFLVSNEGVPSVAPFVRLVARHSLWTLVEKVASSIYNKISRALGR